ncbi:hypothetical protein Moror_10338 [Moniliophthora roreri MCA 2997]|uniref:Uncharacterized protein n=1 Tax=Moniliophthora roreri (strain MCA 2997) TaxID=1381753 RepID=V2YK24_MONRO|nr:hypothetical protein Moror_10338 [Moniliophthora roreri MCA 2997]
MQRPEPLLPITEHLGTDTFFPALISHLQHTCPSLPIEPVIVQSILLCLIAGKHLILRTTEDDLGLVGRLAVKTLSTIFGRTTHKLRVKKSQNTNPNAFLRTLFLPSANHGGSSSIYNSQDESSTITGHRKTKRRRKRVTSRSRSRNAPFRSTQRSVSSPNVTQVKPSSFISSSDDPFHGSRPISNPFSSTSSKSFSLASPTFTHSHSDPTPLRIRDLTNPQLPDALVIQGLENASFLAQNALSTLLLERRLILEGDDSIESPDSSNILDEPDIEGTWPLPDDFILVYVCTLDEWERPLIHRTLLDRFAMSATVKLDSSIHAAATALFRPLSFRNSPILSPAPLSPASSHTPTSSPPYFSQPLPNRTWSPGLQAAVNNSAPLINAQFIKILRLTHAKVHFPPTLQLYLADLMSAARHHPQLEGRLLTAIAMKDAIDLTRACRVLAGDPTGMELIQDVLAEEDEDVPLHFGPNSDTTATALADVANENSVTILHPSPFENGSLNAATEDEAGEDESTIIPILDVSQADIGRIIPRVVSHRVRVRDGPEDEILASAMFGAALQLSEEHGTSRGRQVERKERSPRCTTVKDILISILSEV